ncbi:Mu transposase C-terminal domain-containing protein [Aliarcobacter butzleri]|uniref:Mu transposase C-terminal domain-containing protein n=1 Tax=Aliarcobacter butzleri TaxID=28197 RepID=UPI00263C036B|nr:Mu transposase C-terminal domain-containing protein [Aliarcobacter butzleri]MDN5058672.1 DDE-type integrase/transposase/recombinase [Aliarcobacter butzleri]
MINKVSESITINRSSLKIQENEFVQYKNDIYKISAIIDFNYIVGINLETKRPKRLEIKTLKAISSENISKDISIFKDVNDFKDEEFSEIQEKYLAIQPLLKNQISRDEIEEHANKIGVHFTTLYRWLNKYKSTGTLAGLLPRPSGRKKGETRLDFQTEEVIQKVIESYYLTHQKPSVQAVINKINIECKNRNITPPGKNTIRNRIHKLSEYDVLRKRGNKSLARTLYKPTPGKFVAEYPMQLIEIDHTPVDLILVDDQHRKPIGKPWITVAIDIYSRMIVGYYLSLNAPSVTSVAMCISNTVLPKDELLLKLDIDSNWDVWGFPETIHVDNGADFRADTIKHAGLLHGINIEFRPVGQSNFGGHIERVIGTLMNITHEIPGTTFSNIQQKGEINPDKNASMTFSEFERFLVTFITKVYHKRLHEGIKMSPEQLWDIGIFGDEAPIGLPPKPSDSQSVLIDFLPYFKRTIQKNGINIEGLNYYDYVLRSKIHEIDEETGKKKQFICKRDPRNIKFIWFYDDNVQQYYKISVADQSLPNMTLWEYDLIKRNLYDKGIQNINHAQIIEAHEELYQQIESSVKKSKKARREQQRIVNKDKEIKAFNESQTKIDKKNEIVYISNDTEDDDIPDFG